MLRPDSLSAPLPLQAGPDADREPAASPGPRPDPASSPPGRLILARTLQGLGAMTGNHASFALLVLAVTMFSGWTSFALSQPDPTRDPLVAGAIPQAQVAQLESARAGFAPGEIRTSELSLALARAGRHLLKYRPVGFRDDCSGFISAVVSRAGVPMNARVRQMWNIATTYGTSHFDPVPLIGDLVFFDNTYDADRNLRWDDPRSHVALVVDVEPDGTIIMVHNGGGNARSLIRMNLQQPHVYKDATGKVLNSVLRTRKWTDPAHAVYLTGEMWNGFATVEPDQQYLPKD